MRDLHILPKLRDSLSYLYIEQAIVQRDHHALEVVDDTGRVLVPVASLSVLLLGPGTSITHAAIGVLAENGCSVLWVGEDATHFYAQGIGETRKGLRLLRQAGLVSDSQARQDIVLRMYRYRFGENLDPDLSLPQIRGLEGVRVRQAYAEASERFGVPWHGRRYDRGSWNNSDPVNRALSAANALLNGICHAAIVSGGYSPALGFVHTGKQLSFVYDVADLYKTEITVPVAFQTVGEGEDRVEARVRQACRTRFREVKLLERILPDIDFLFQMQAEPEPQDDAFDSDPALPAALWFELDEQESS
ncbi:MAG TPA: type I-E CRISPR-associated endonuclease Cas1e [Aggregatilineaceae bacterium]|jgi:CRISPR-associated protein Cas1|nr:type I-E CRISPR-associated endonuclease Cas1e [Aggregatilineaceae bacterium]